MSVVLPDVYNSWQLAAGTSYLGAKNMLSGYLHSGVVCFLLKIIGFQYNQIHIVSSYGEYHGPVTNKKISLNSPILVVVDCLIGMAFLIPKQFSVSKIQHM